MLHLNPNSSSSSQHKQHKQVEPIHMRTTATGPAPNTLRINLFNHLSPKRHMASRRTRPLNPSHSHSHRPDRVILPTAPLEGTPPAMEATRLDMEDTLRRRSRGMEPPRKLSSPLRALGHSARLIRARRLPRRNGKLLNNSSSSNSSD